MEQLRLSIIELCNKSELPLEAVLFVVRDVYKDVNSAFEAVVREAEVNKVKEEVEDDSSID